MFGSITKTQTLSVPGFLIGHFSPLNQDSGCSVVLCPQGAVGSVFVAGGSPCGYDLSLLAPTASISRIHSVLLTGGSVFGLSSAAGVLRWLSEKNMGLNVFNQNIPLICGAAIYDLQQEPHGRCERTDWGYQACHNAKEQAFGISGLVGAGKGATLGKLLGHANAMRSGIGTAAHTCCVNGQEIHVGCLAVVNALGDIRNKQGQIIAGARTADKKGFLDTQNHMQNNLFSPISPNQATTLLVVVTDVALDKSVAYRLSRFLMHNLSTVITPFASLWDGDILFFLSSGQSTAVIHEVSLGAMALAIAQDAIINTVSQTSRVSS